VPGRRLLAAGLWLGVTATATAIVWTGTSTVAADLTDRPAPVVAHRDVVSALQSDAPAPETAPGISAPEPIGSPPAGQSGGAGSGVEAPDTPASGTAQPPANAVAPEREPATPPTTQPTSPPTTEDPRHPTATFSMAGGVVTVACKNAFFIDLVSATPGNGYAVNVVNRGPFYVEVHFVRPGRDDPLWAYCLGVPIRAYGGGASIPGLPG